MRCRCGGRSEVIDSRQRDDGSVRRRRICTKCGLRWSTLEQRTVFSTAKERLAEGKRKHDLLRP